MQQRWFGLALASGLLLARGPAAADPGELPELSLDGYWKTRGVFIKNLFLGQPSQSDIVPTGIEAQDERRKRGLAKTGYLLHHLRLHPEAHYEDLLSLKMDLDVLEGVVFGDNAGVAAVPLFAGSPSDTDLSGKEVETLRARRVWVELELPVGSLRVGRMPSHWGMGLLANHGDGLDADFNDYGRGSTVDRILFATKPVTIARTLLGCEDPASNLVVAVAYDKLVDDAQPSGEVDAERACETCAPLLMWARPADDVDEWVGVLLYRDDEANIAQKDDHVQAGVYVVHRRQVDTRSKVWVYDAHLKLRVHDFGLETEILWIRGKSSAIESGENPKSVDIKGGVVKGGYYAAQLDLELEYGRAPGDDEVTDETFTGYPFHADYNVGLLLYEQILAARTASAWGRGQRGLWSRGAVWNSAYLYPKIRWRPRDTLPGLTVIAAFLWARADEDTNAVWWETREAEPEDLDLGYEIDLAVRYDFYGRAHIKLEGGVFFPGRALWNDVEPEEPRDLLITNLDRADPAWTIQSRLAWEL